MLARLAAIQRSWREITRLFTEDCLAIEVFVIADTMTERSLQRAAHVAPGKRATRGRVARRRAPRIAEGDAAQFTATDLAWRRVTGEAEIRPAC